MPIGVLMGLPPGGVMVASKVQSPAKASTVLVCSGVGLGSVGTAALARSSPGLRRTALGPTARGEPQRRGHGFGAAPPQTESAESACDRNHDVAGSIVA